MTFDRLGISFRFSFGPCADKVCPRDNPAYTHRRWDIGCSAPAFARLQLENSNMAAGPAGHAVDNGSSAGEAAQGSEERPALPELPYHRFSNGDGILLVSTLDNGEVPKTDSPQASSAAQPRFQEGSRLCT